jgi:hypothetical protein
VEIVVEKNGPADGKKDTKNSHFLTQVRGSVRKQLQIEALSPL